MWDYGFPVPVHTLGLAIYWRNFSSTNQVRSVLGHELVNRLVNSCHFGHTGAGYDQTYRQKNSNSTPCQAHLSHLGLTS
jgi:hypothetical protein